MTSVSQLQTRAGKTDALPCAACGFDMTGVRMRQGEWPMVRCPECGHACDCRALKAQRSANQFVLWMLSVCPALPLVAIAMFAPQWLMMFDRLLSPSAWGMIVLMALPFGHAVLIEMKAGWTFDLEGMSLTPMCRALVTISCDLAALFMASDAVMRAAMPSEWL